MVRETFTQGEAYTAMCLWEEVTAGLAKADAELGDAPWTQYRDRNGTADLRDEVLGLAPACEAAWNAMTDDQQEGAGAFDWEFCPKWLRESVDWFGIPKVKGEAA